MSKIIAFKLDPCAKPRMTKQDRWKKRPIVLKYWKFKDDINRKARKKNFTLPERFDVIFLIPMPGSWSKKKRRELVGTPHLQRPDTDNLVKGLKDALLEEDSKCWDEGAYKFWSYEGYIIIKDKTNERIPTWIRSRIQKIKSHKSE